MYRGSKRKSTLGVTRSAANSFEKKHEGTSGSGRKSMALKCQILFVFLAIPSLLFLSNGTVSWGWAENNVVFENLAVDTSERLSPFFSTKPLTKSLHPKFKLWTEMSSTEQDEAMEFVGQYMTKYGKLIKPEGGDRGYLMSIRQGECKLDETIKSHNLCGPKPEGECNFISFGINDNYSWDTEVANAWGCRGFAADPTVHHPSKLHPNVTFHNIGATVLQDNEERLINKGGGEKWWMTSVPKLRYFLNLEKIDILKMDCEGCEVAMARDILREDPEFLRKVDQISIETHVTKTWMTTREHVYYFGLMFPLLEEAGFKMEWSSIFGCSKRHEITGCMPEFKKYGWPCGYRPSKGRPNVVLGESCQEFSWKRY